MASDDRESTAFIGIANFYGASAISSLIVWGRLLFDPFDISEATTVESSMDAAFQVDLDLTDKMASRQ